MAVLDQLPVVRVIDEHHLAKRNWLMIGIEKWVARHDFAFLSPLRLAQRLARDARHNHHHGHGCEQADILQDLLVEVC